MRWRDIIQATRTAVVKAVAAMEQSLLKLMFNENDKITTFPDENTIVETYTNYKVTNVFNPDGSIVQTRSKLDGSNAIVKTTTFDETTGKITEKIG